MMRSLEVISIEIILTTFEEKDSNLTKVKVDEVFRFMSNIGPKVSSNNSMPVKRLYPF